MRALVITLSLGLLCGVAQAAYRVYRLSAVAVDAWGRPQGRPYVVLTTLDPYQYEQFSGAGARLRTTLIESWFCPGDTRGFRPYCDRPKVKEDRIPASDSKRVTLPYDRQPVIP